MENKKEERLKKELEEIQPTHYLVPKEHKESNRLVPNELMLYYKVDDSCNFQTLSVDVYGLATEIPSIVIGRFHGSKLPSGKFKLDNIETKAFSLKAIDGTYKRGKGEDRKTVKDIGFVVKNVILNPFSTEDYTSFTLIIEESKNNNRKNRKIDYVYGDHEGEPSVIIKTDAKLEFIIKNASGGKPTGGYECDGEATTGGG